MITITHILWKKRAIGVALRNMPGGNSMIQITVHRKDGTLYYPRPFMVNREDIIRQFGIEKVNEPSLMGVWLPLSYCEERMMESKK
jgi:hypothetical protein